MKNFAYLGFALLTTLTACGGDDDSTPAVDGSVTVNSSTPAVDSAVVAVDATTPAGNSYSLNGVTTAASVVCGTDIIAGSNSNRTSFQLTFKGTPVAGTYTVEPATSRSARPSAAMGTVVSYGSDPAGGPKVEQVGQSGTVTVNLVGGKLHAVAVAIPSKDLQAGMATGTIAGNLTCP